MTEAEEIELDAIRFALDYPIANEMGYKSKDLKIAFMA